MTTFDPVWDEKYAGGHEQRYPWDMVVSFVFRHAPRDRPRNGVRILEVGCGTGANLRFAAAEGFAVCGVDGSRHAIDTARRRFAEAGLEGDLRIADFTTLPFEDGSCDLAIDRGALSCCGTTALRAAIAGVARCLKPGGKFLFNPLADSHSSARAGRAGDDDLVVDIAAGTLQGAGHIRFVARREIEPLLAPGFRPLSIERKEIADMTGPAGMVHAEWIVIAEKTA